MDALRTIIGSFILACFFMAMPILAVLALCLHWNEGIAILTIIVSVCEFFVLWVFIGLYDDE